MPPRRQYVNLKPDVAEQLGPAAALVPAARAGTSVRLKATLQAEGNAAVVGRTIKFRRVATADNLTPTGCLGAMWRLGEKKKSGTTNAQGEATVDFDVSAFGGDIFTFEAYTGTQDVKQVQPIGGEQANDDGSVEYEVWRRVYYQKGRLDQAAKGAGRDGNLPAIADLDLANFAATLDGGDKKIRIELVDDTEGGNELIARVLDNRSMNVIEDYDDYVRVAKAGYVRRRDGLTVRIALVYQLADSVVRDGGFAFWDARGIAGQDRLEFPENLWEDESKPLHRDWCERARWKWPDQDWVDMPMEAFSRGGGRTIYLHLGRVPDGQPKPTREHLQRNQMDMDIRWRARTSSAGGGRLRGTNIVVLATSTMGGGNIPAGELRTTLAHELGHALGMVPSGQATHYTEREHRGPHCSSGGTWEGPLMGGWTRPGTCIMFGSDTGQARNAFCDLCAESLRRAKIKLESMPQ